MSAGRKKRKGGRQVEKRIRSSNGKGMGSEKDEVNDQYGRDISQPA